MKIRKMNKKKNAMLKIKETFSFVVLDLQKPIFFSSFFSGSLSIDSFLIGSSIMLSFLIYKVIFAR